jgi:hypothetical protein
MSDLYEMINLLATPHTICQMCPIENPLSIAANKIDEPYMRILEKYLIILRSSDDPLIKIQALPFLMKNYQMLVKSGVQAQIDYGNYIQQLLEWLTSPISAEKIQVLADSDKRVKQLEARNSILEQQLNIFRTALTQVNNSSKVALASDVASPEAARKAGPGMW